MFFRKDSIEIQKQVWTPIRTQSQLMKVEKAAKSQQKFR